MLFVFSGFSFCGALKRVSWSGLDQVENSFCIKLIKCIKWLFLSLSGTWAWPRGGKGKGKGKVAFREDWERNRNNALHLEQLEAPRNTSSMLRVRTAGERKEGGPYRHHGSLRFTYEWRRKDEGCESWKKATGKQWAHQSFLFYFFKSTPNISLLSPGAKVPFMNISL